jgi:uncharacterized protein (TIGR00251 family)
MKQIRDRGDGRVGFRVRVRPSASSDELLGWNTAGELRISIAAPPTGGSANKRLVSFLAKQFSIRREDIRVERGETGRAKILSAPPSVKEFLENLPDI